MGLHCLFANVRDFRCLDKKTVVSDHLGMEFELEIAESKPG